MYFGIEQEIPLIRTKENAFADFSNTTHEELQAIVDELPVYPEDYPRLRVGDLGIKKKRWYVEGFERFDGNGKFLRAVPKSLEIRTTPHESAAGALAELADSYKLLVKSLQSHGFRTTWVSFNPIHSLFTPDPPLNDFEKRLRQESPEAQTAGIAQLTFGPDLSISFPDFNDEQIIDAGKKLTYYSPFILPFSYSSPFMDDNLWSGLSMRTFLRTGARPAALVFLRDEKNTVISKPSLTQPSRVPFEAGRIEFKAFDACREPELYQALFLLLRGIIMDYALPGRALVPDGDLHKRSAIAGFADREIAAEARAILQCARQALKGQPDAGFLDRLDAMLASNRLPVYALIDKYRETGSVMGTLNHYGNLSV